MYLKTDETWHRIPRIYHPAHCVYSGGHTDPPHTTRLPTEKDWWYDNDTGIWWCKVARGWQVARASRIPKKKLATQTWTSPEHVSYTAVLYNTTRHYRQHCDQDDDATIPRCISFEPVSEPAPSYEHPTSLWAQHGAWIPNRCIYFGVPSYDDPTNTTPPERQCPKCFWYISSVSVADLEETYHITMHQADKTQMVAFGPLHIETILGLHANYCVDDIWIAPSDGVTPPAYHQFTSKLVDYLRVDERESE